MPSPTPSTPPPIATRIAALTATACLALSALTPAPSAALEPPPPERGFVLRARALGGYDHALLTAPADPAGDPQFMSGTAFAGPGGAVGVGAWLQVHALFAVELDLLLAFERFAGFEDAGAWRRDLSLSTTRLHAPMLGHVGWIGARGRATVALGLQLSFTLSAEATLTERGVPPGDRLALALSAPFQLGLPFVIEGAWRVPDADVWIPLSLRAVWFPGVGDTSVERFEGFTSPEQPGALIAAPTWTLLILTGVEVHALGALDGP